MLRGLVESPEARFRRARLGLALFLVSLGVAFIGLLVLYGILRSGMGGWPPPGFPKPPLLLPSLNTVVVIASSATLEWVLRGQGESRHRHVRWGLLVTANLGALFLVIQALLARQAIAMGLEAGGSIYASLLFAIAGFHAAHVVVGLAALVGFAWMASRKNLHVRTLEALRLWTVYWHFVGGAWIVIFVLVFVC